METKDIFSRTQATSTGADIGPRLYNLIIGLVLVWGFAFNWLIIETVPLETLQSIPSILFIIFYFLCAFGGIFLFTSSSSPIMSFLGYNLVVLPFGLIVHMAVSRYDTEVVQNSIRITGLVTLLMMVAGTLFPAFFRRIAGALAIALLGVIVVQLIEIFFLDKHYGIIDWIVVVIFCGYIGVDWGRANSIPKTLDNAIDSAAALYMDIINLFMAILRITGRRK